MVWGFYGRRSELAQLEEILRRGRFFFVKVTGRRRIGKTTLIRQALNATGLEKIFYLQIPDSGAAGVLSAAGDAMDTFAIDPASFPRPKNLDELASISAALCRAGYVVVLDEFQYFHRERLREFTSFLQREVDALSATAEECRGGLVVLGSLHAEIQALLDDRAAPLFNRTTDEIALPHLDLAAVAEILDTHADRDAARMLFAWTLFEGVPKFYRDCYEQGVLGAGRRELLRKMFFESSSPLRTEADNWFLKELHGRYDVVLKYIARQPGASHADIEAYVKQTSRDQPEQVAGYVKVLIERYELIEKKLPIFAGDKARRSRYYLADNFLVAWLAALANPVAALTFSPVERLLDMADGALENVEGNAFEKLVAQAYEERSRKGVGDFALTSRIQGYWDRSDTEIDLVALNDDERRIRFGDCKRSSERLVRNAQTFIGHTRRFLEAFPRFEHYRVERVGLTVSASPETRKALEVHGVGCQDLNELIEPLR